MNHEVKISEVQIMPVKPNAGLVAFASFVLDENFYVGSVAIYTRLNGGGHRLVYPSKKVGEVNINTFYPINHAVGEAIEKAVTGKFAELFNERESVSYHD